MGYRAVEARSNEVTANMPRRIVLLVALGSLFASAACRKQAACDAQARAEAYGVSTVRIAGDVVYATYGERQLKLDVYRPPASRQQSHRG